MVGVAHGGVRDHRGGRRVARSALAHSADAARMPDSTLDCCAALPVEVKLASLDGWLIKLGARFPQRWHARFFAFAAETCSLSYFQFRR